MKVVINGCGRVGRALLGHWIGEVEAPKVILLRGSIHQWREDGGLREDKLQDYLDNPQPFTQPRQSIEEVLLLPIDMWFELTPTDLKGGGKVHEEVSQVLERGIPVFMVI